MNKYIKEYYKYYPFLILLTLIATYIFLIKKQYYPIFYEDQFIHINFIRDLINNKISFKNLFAVFGEHLFPGYGLIVVINYYLFSLSLSLETILTVVFNVAAAGIIYYLWKITNYKSAIGGITALLIMLSPVQYPMKSMALVANFSVLILIPFFYNLVNRKIGIKDYIILSIYALCVAGAYSAGFIVAYISYLYIEWRRNKKFNLQIKLSAYIVFLYIVYLCILYIQGTLGTVGSHSIEIFKSINFGLIMAGSSILGKAVYESGMPIQFYIFTGLYVILISGYAAYLSLNNLNKPHVYVSLLIIVYSCSIILIASYARYQNGMELAMGQWYQHHIKYLPALSCILIGTLSSRKMISNFMLSIILLFGGYGYYCEYKKAPYAREWKKNISSSVFEYLDDSISSNDMTTGKFYWPNGWTRDGLKLMYEHSIGYFTAPIVIGLNDDGWVTSEDSLKIICQRNQKRLTIFIDNIRVKNTATLVNNYNGKYSNNEYTLNLTSDNNYKKYIVNVKELIPEINLDSVDKRPLLFHLKKISCN